MHRSVYGAFGFEFIRYLFIIVVRIACARFLISSAQKELGKYFCKFNYVLSIVHGTKFNFMREVGVKPVRKDRGDAWW